MDKEFFIAICDKLEAEIPELRWIDQEEGQLSVPQPPVAFPCCLVDISYPSCETHMGGKQKIRAQVQLKVAFVSNGQTNAAAPASVREKALKRLDTLNEIHQTLQWWNADGLFNPLRRIRCVPEKRTDGLKVYNVTYETEFMD